MNSVSSYGRFERDALSEGCETHTSVPSTCIRKHVNRNPLIALSALMLSLLASELIYAHGGVGIPNDTSGRTIVFPDTEQYVTLIVDLHTHSVFSDGHVWPKIRVAEALRDGLDALAITEHLEYQPHRLDIPHPDRNRAYDDAKIAGRNSELIVIRGSEITRNAPAGHVNAVFLDDANKLLKVDNPPSNPGDVSGYSAAARKWPAQKAIEAANAQDAFLFWNHPWWTRQQRDGIYPHQRISCRQREKRSLTWHRNSEWQHLFRRSLPGRTRSRSRAYWGFRRTRSHRLGLPTT